MNEQDPRATKADLRIEIQRLRHVHSEMLELRDQARQAQRKAEEELETCQAARDRIAGSLTMAEKEVHRLTERLLQKDRDIMGQARALGAFARELEQSGSEDQFQSLTTFAGPGPWGS